MGLDRYWSWDTWIWIILLKSKVFVLEIEDALDLRIDLHLWKLARLACELQSNLFEMICIDVSISGSMYELACFKAADLRYHHGKESV